MAFIESPLFFRRAQVRRLRPDVPGGALFHGEIRVLFASDIHVSWMFPERRLTRLLSQIASLSPDLILWGGDYAETREEQELFFSQVQARLHPPLGMYGAIGNNDRECFGMNLADATECMRAHGVTPLVNRSVRVPCRGGAFAIGALDDWKHGSPGGRLFEDAQEGDVCILLSHHPRLAYTHLSCCSRRPDLMLSGHTHGGQWNLFGLNPFSVLGMECRGLEGKKKLVSGLYRVENVPVLVSNGIGTSRIPLRIGAPSQLHLISFGG